MVFSHFLNDYRHAAVRRTEQVLQVAEANVLCDVLARVEVQRTVRTEERPLNIVSSNVQL